MNILKMWKTKVQKYLEIITRDICVVINSKYTVFMSEEIIANYKIDMKENEKKP